MISRIALATRNISAVSTKWSAITLPKRSYHENVIDHYENPRNVGSLDVKDAAVGTGTFIFLKYFPFLFDFYNKIHSPDDDSTFGRLIVYSRIIYFPL